MVKGKHFKFFTVWADHSECQKQVATSWDQQVHGTKQYILCEKLQRLKEVLKELNQRDFAHITATVESAKTDLKAAQLELQEQPYNVELKSMVARLRKKIVTICS